VCPECGGHLSLTDDFDVDGDDNPAMFCENEAGIDSQDDDGHLFWQSDWQPVIGTVSAYLRTHNRVAGGDDLPQLSHHRTYGPVSGGSHVDHIHVAP